MRNFLPGVLLAMIGLAPAAQAQEWVLEQSTIAYHVSHLLHELEGVSHAAKGKGACRKDHCDFLIAAPVKSFDSGDSNRDLHMLQVTKAAEFPMVVVRSSGAPAIVEGSSFSVDLEIEFAGRKALYRQVRLTRSETGPLTRLTGTIPLILTDFKIERPSFLAVPIKDSTPVRVEMTWRRKDDTP